jgi:hypothetical protein
MGHAAHRGQALRRESASTTASSYNGTYIKNLRLWWKFRDFGQFGTFFKIRDFGSRTMPWRRIMPYTIRRWSDYDIAKLKSMAQKYPTAAIAAQLGRSTAATIVKAHELNLSLRVRPEKRTTKVDPGPSGIELPSD